LSAQSHSRRYKLAGVMVLVIGMLCAGVVYWLGRRSAELADDPAMSNFYKAESRQMGALFGKQGMLIEDLRNDLRQPGTQAVLIAGGSLLVSIGCFIWARYPDNHTETIFKPGKSCSTTDEHG